MTTVALFVSLTACVAISFQDFQRRLIHIGNILLLAVSLLVFRWQVSPIALSSFFANLLYLMALVITLFLYFKIKYKGKKFINRYVGLGDVLILLVFCLAYTLFGYTVFVLVSCIAGLLYWCLQNMLFKRKTIRIPFAGMMTGVHILLSLLDFLYPLHQLSESLTKL